MKRVTVTILTAGVLLACSALAVTPISRPSNEITGPSGSKVTINLDGSITISSASGTPIAVYGSTARFDTGPIDLGAIAAPSVSGASDFRIYWDGANLKYSANGGAFANWSLAADVSLSAANAFTNLQSITRSNAQTQTNTITGLGIATLPGLQLTNTTPAAAGAQQYSPSIRLTGQGWKTTATAASQAVEFRAYVVPVQGSANPSAYLSFDYSINGGAFTNAFSLFSSGNMAVGSTSDPNSAAAGIIRANSEIQAGNGMRTENFFGWRTLGTIYGIADGVWRLTDNAGTSFGRLQFGGTTSSYPALKRSGATMETRLADDSGFAAAQSLYIRFGSGSPEGAVTAPVGATYNRTDGGAGTSFYVKESGTGNTGWVAK